ncbi:hypothetical protein [Roseibium algae]|uniref:MFS transporter n=1 Tax=Roseibium algae TaxID=3123038 RepID=A0ABU8TPF3_9HYPH
MPAPRNLVYGTLLVAKGYGATFVFNRHFKSFGGDEIDTGAILIAAMIGPLISVSSIVWSSARIGAATLDGIGALFLSLGFTNMMAGVGLSTFIAEFMLDQLDVSTSLFFGGVATACLLTAGLLFLFENRSPVARTSGTISPWGRSIGQISASTSRFPIIMVALGAGVFSGAMTFQSTLIENTPLTEGTFFVAYAITVVIASWFPARLVTDYSSRVAVPLLLVIMTAGAAVLSALAYGVAAQIVSAVLLGIGYGLVYPLIQAQAVNDAPGKTHQNAALTWFVLWYLSECSAFR